MQRNQTVTVVIPVHNEAKYIANCIESLLQQTYAPDEIVVVDNDCSDDSMAIVRSFESPIIRIVNEPRRGILYARSAGFDAADGDIILRTDADSYANSDWIERMLEYFSDDSTMLVAGRLKFYDIPLKHLIDALVLATQYTFCSSKGLSSMVNGANSGIRRQSWRRISQHACFDVTLHEDIDLSIHAHLLGERLVYNPKAIVNTSGRRIADDRIDFHLYAEKIETTYAHHGKQAMLSKIAVPMRMVRATVISFGGIRE